MPKHKKKITVLVQGAFEILHFGHIKCLKRAKECGDFLIVALNSNALLKEYKNREPVLSYEDKRRTLEAIRYVDKVVPAHKFSPITLLKGFDVDVYVVADEWLKTKDLEVAYMKEKGGRVVVLPRYKGVTSTSAIKAKLLDEAKAGE